LPEKEAWKERWENLIQNLIMEGILKSPSVIRAMRLVPRALFLPERDQPYAAVDSPLPIGEGQTVSAPQG
jgi:protein-L-isoaspartate(D-aspartate) O-methyltransferase